MKLVDIEGWPHYQNVHKKPIPGAIYRVLKDGERNSDNVEISRGFPGIKLNRVKPVPRLIED